MPGPDQPSEENDAPAPAGLAEAGVYAHAAAGFEHGLVVLAMGEPFWLERSEAGYRLLVEPPVLAAVQEQLACFDRESLGWPPRPAAEETRPRRAGSPTALLWAVAVLAVFAGQVVWPGRWEEAGALDPAAVFDRGEWWRLGTALFLHADVGHLLANLISGLFAFSAVLATLGRGRGWLLLALAALLGNLAIAGLNYAGPYRSLGASTAVFAALGLLTGRAVRVLLRPDRPHPWRAVFAPLAAGLTLLALLGAGDSRTDVGAHVAGFAAGLVLGFLAKGRRAPSAAVPAIQPRPAP
jgi:rhomboid protease GluP